MFYAEFQSLSHREKGQERHQRKGQRDLQILTVGMFYSTLAYHYNGRKQTVYFTTQNLGVYLTGCGRNLH